MFLVLLWGRQDPSSPTRDRTCAPCSGSSVLTAGPPENSPFLFLTWGHLARRPEGHAHQFTLGAHVLFIFLIYFFMFWGHKACKVLVSGPGIESLLPAVEAECLTPRPPGLSQLSSSLKQDALWRERPAPPAVMPTPASALRRRAPTWHGCTGRAGQPGPHKPAPALLTGLQPHPAPWAPRFPAPAQEPLLRPQLPGDPALGSPQGPGHAAPPPWDPGPAQACGAYPGM